MELDKPNSQKGQICHRKRSQKPNLVFWDKPLAWDVQTLRNDLTNKSQLSNVATFEQ